MVLTTGTFLRGLIHIGEAKSVNGRAGEPASVKLAERLKDLNFRLGRLKTGTPPRLDGKTINYSQLAEQPGDTPPPPFSFLTPAITCVLDVNSYLDRSSRIDLRGFQLQVAVGE